MKNLECLLKAIVAPIFVLILLVSAQVNADVRLTLGPCVQTHVVNGDEKNAVSGESLTLANGTQQLVVDCEAMLGRSDDDAFPESSETFVLLFDAADAVLTLSAPRLQTRQQMAAFNQQKDFRLVNAEGEALSYQIGVLEKEGFQVFRDYLDELEAFNRTPAPAALRMQLPGASAAAGNVTDAVPHVGEQGAPDQETVRQMLRYWYLQADRETREEWKNWIQSSK
ncbi:DUF2057 domain-containing protein [Marinobacter lutaoensis]|nr:DUF2057 domain-containing protein [Marinobacter lutaoensis]